MDIKTYWEKFQEQNKTNKQYCEAYYFCDNKEDADELAELVLAGKKKATASNHMMYQYDNESLPEVGDLCIITDYSNEPLCVVETTNIDIVPFKDVTPEFAAKEGEGDLSLEYWRDAHRRFFTRELQEIGIEFTEDILVVCESFKVIYK